MSGRRVLFPEKPASPGAFARLVDRPETPATKAELAALAELHMAATHRLLALAVLQTRALRMLAFGPDEIAKIDILRTVELAQEVVVLGLSDLHGEEGLSFEDLEAELDEQWRRCGLSILGICTRYDEEHHAANEALPDDGGVNGG